MKIGEFIVFRVKNPDDGLVRVPVDYEEIIFRVLTITGEVASFKTQLLNKNIPLLLLKFPETEIETFIRSHSRHHVKINTPIILVSREDVAPEKEVAGMGTLTNLSEGGCRISTALKLESGDKIRFFLNLTGTGTRELIGIVRRVGKPSGGVTNYGIRFTGLNIRNMRELEDFMKRVLPQDAEGR
jgi:hypothetical protein